MSVVSPWSQRAVRRAPAAGPGRCNAVFARQVQRRSDVERVGLVSIALRHHHLPADAERKAARGGIARTLRHGDEPHPRGADAAGSRGPGRARAEQGLPRLRGVASEPARPDEQPRRDRDDRAALVARKRRRRVGGQSAERLPPPVAADQDRPDQPRRDQRGLEPRARRFPRGAGLRLRLADTDGHPGAPVRTGRSLCRAVDHVERTAARRRHRAQALDARRAQSRDRQGDRAQSPAHHTHAWTRSPPRSPRAMRSPACLRRAGSRRNDRPGSQCGAVGVRRRTRPLSSPAFSPPSACPRRPPRQSRAGSSTPTWKGCRRMASCSSICISSGCARAPSRARKRPPSFRSITAPLFSTPATRSAISPAARR